MFAVYIDDLIIDIVKRSVGCNSHFVSVYIVVYADDILLLAPSVAALQRLVSLCDLNLQSLDLAINIKKSVCTRIGPRFNAPCANITTSDGSNLQRVDSIRYLGVFIVRFDLESLNVPYIMLSKLSFLHSILYMARQVDQLQKR